MNMKSVLISDLTISKRSLSFRDRIELAKALADKLD